MGSCSSKFRVERRQKNLIDLGELSFLVHGRPKKFNSTHATGIFAKRDIANFEDELDFSDLDDEDQEMN